MEHITVKLKDKEYKIFIQKGLIDIIGAEIRKIYSGEKIAVITDENVDRIWGESLMKSLMSSGFSTSKIVIPPGEKSKSFDTLINVYSSLAKDKVSRGDLIITFGGGVVGDLGGFAAATYLRGIPFVQVPTTLLAQIDSSVGGKVAVDLEQGKNLVGSFYHPEAVFIDPELLKSLDKRVLNDGMAEAIKYGCIRDKALFDRLWGYEDYDELYSDMEYIIRTCCTIKRDIVEIDEKDIAERMLLNFGHTFGHAIEKYYNYEKYTHGEAVAAGMYLITANSERLGMTRVGTSDKIKGILEKYSLPYDIGMKGSRKVIESLSLDKKNIGGGLNLIIIDEIGESRIHKCSVDYIMNNFKF